jgi:hypothetical protein
MIRNNDNERAIKQMREKEKQVKDDAIKVKCEALAKERYGEEKVVSWSNTNKGLFYLPIMNDNDEIEKLGVLKPIDRNILSFASTKINDAGLYAFLEACMRECWIDGDTCILDEDEYFIPAANTFNKILEGKKAALLKR